MHLHMKILCYTDSMFNQNNEPTTVRLFKNGQNQALRIPKALEFDGIDEVAISKKGDSLVITPVRKNWKSFAELPKATLEDDFMTERPDLINEKRIIF